MNIVCKINVRKGFDSLIDDITAEGVDETCERQSGKSISRVAMILDTMVSVSNNVLRLCSSGLDVSLDGDGGMNDYVNKALLEADLIKQHIIGRKLIFNDCKI